MTIRKICGLTVGIMLVLFLLIPISTSAKENVQLKVNVDAGFSNQAKTLRSYPVTITIKNNGDDFQGDMVLTVPKDFSGFYNRVFHLKIPSGTTKEVKFTMPAFEQSMISDIQRGHRVNFLHIYDGKWQEGHEVDLGKAYDLMPLFGDPTQLYIGALTNNPDALNSLKLTNYQQQTPRVIVLSKDSFPDDGDALATLDTIVIGDFDIKTLSEKTN